MRVVVLLTNNRPIVILFVILTAIDQKGSVGFCLLPGLMLGNAGPVASTEVMEKISKSSHTAPKTRGQSVVTPEYSLMPVQHNQSHMPNRERKSMGAETTFEQDLTDYAAIADQLSPLVIRVWAYCERTSKLGRTVTVKVKYADFQQITRSRTMLTAVTNLSQLQQLSMDLLLGIQDLTKGVRLVGISLSSFQTNQALPSGQLKLDL